MSADWLDLARLHAPLIAILAPLLGAAASLCIPSPRWSWAIGVLSAAAGALIAAELAVRVLWLNETPPNVVEGVMLSPDGVGVFAAALISVCTAIALIAGVTSSEAQSSHFAPLAIALALFAGGGWIAATLASDLILVLLAAETAWLASVGLLVLSGERHAALNGALRMLIAGAVGSALSVTGLALIWRSSGDLSVAALALAEATSPWGEAVGVGLVLSGWIVKAGVAPLGFWIGSAFSRASVLAALCIGVVGIVSALMLIARIAAHAFAMPEVGGGLSLALAAIGGLAIAAGSVQAIGARNLRRLAAYAGAAQAGGVLLCVALGSPAGFAAALVQTTALAAAMLALYAAAGAGGVDSLDTLDGLARRAPLAGVAVMFGAVSLIGAPLTIGFLGRWRLVEAAVGVGWWWAVGAMTFASLAAVFYAGRLIERAYFRHLRVAPAAQGDGWRVMLAPALLASIVLVAVGLAPGALLQAADAAASAFGVAP
ncbi:MAG: hypothetical protein K2P58_01630 [Hyphomonadaceae bacterium]|nr:hypothetical protein [Hyphomonadaceae bacterium]